MSGFVAIFRRDGMPVNRELLNGLTSFLAFRGPDERQSWSNGPVGLGHTLLRTSSRASNERQPLSVDGRRWITGDVRLDQGSVLREQLLSAGQNVDRLASDAALVLHAYSAWREEGVNYLRGDFSFVIWDSQSRQFFCARDHFGVRPFYYAETPEFVVCSNTLDCVRQYPGISEELDEDAVADFLLFGLNCDKSTTIFEGIRRLPPAHCACFSSDNSSLRRYWSVPVDGRIRYRRPQEYVEHFQQLLRTAVEDRLDVDRVGIFLSGGMDSGAIAATAKEVADNKSSETELRAYTVTYEKLLGDREGHFAAETARFLGIPHSVIPMDHVRPFAYAEDSDICPPEPIDDPLLGGLYEQYAAVARDSRVVLDGEGIDNLMHFQLGPYVKDLFRRGEWLELMGVTSRYLWRQRKRWPRIGSRIQRRFNAQAKYASAPEWIEPTFAQRARVIERIQAFGLPMVAPAHPTLPDGHASLELPHWTRMFEVADAGFTGKTVEVRYPFLDLRMVEFVLALPPYPFLFNKALERDSLRGKLPEKIINRPKTPLSVDPADVALQRTHPGTTTQCQWSQEIERYVRPTAMKFSSEDPHAGYVNPCIRAICFNFWLQSTRRVRYNLCMEVRNG
jgi:asparagine synthase (glutamine-hydrolysing)